MLAALWLRAISRELVWVKSCMRRCANGAGVGKNVVAMLCCVFAAPTLLVTVNSPAALLPAESFASNACSSLATPAHAVSTSCYILQKAEFFPPQYLWFHAEGFPTPKVTVHFRVL